jgi:regulator of nonsense transcripts 2
MKDVASMLLQLLEEEFNFLINKKDQMDIETKIRNIRFIGELAKFKIALVSFVFTSLKVSFNAILLGNIFLSQDFIPLFML